jgi:tetratricopeptide (TPR) repeat protein
MKRKREEIKEDIGAIIPEAKKPKIDPTDLIDIDRAAKFLENSSELFSEGWIAIFQGRYETANYLFDEAGENAAYANSLLPSNHFYKEYYDLLCNNYQNYQQFKQFFPVVESLLTDGKAIEARGEFKSAESYFSQALYNLEQVASFFVPHNQDGFSNYKQLCNIAHVKLECTKILIERDSLNEEANALRTLGRYGEALTKYRKAQLQLKKGAKYDHKFKEYIDKLQEDIDSCEQLMYQLQPDSPLINWDVTDNEATITGESDTYYV